MNDFKNVYQSAVQDVDMPGMNQIHIDAFQCMDEGRHRRRMMKRMRRTMTTTFSTMCIIFICGFGTVKAAEYFENVIRVNEWGFESADAVTMEHNGAQGGQVYVMKDEVALAAVPEETVETESILVPEQTGQSKQMSDPEPAHAGDMEKRRAAVNQPDANAEQALVSENPEGISASATEQQGDELTSDSVQIAMAEEDTAGNKEMQAMSAAPVQEYSAMGESNEAAKNGVTANAEAGVIAEVEMEEIPMKNYSSWEEFYQNETILFPQPSITIGEQIEATDISVCGDWAMVRYDVDGKVLWLERTDYANTRGHASSKVFPGGVCNERTYTTPAGYTYTLIDSVKEKEEEQLQIHAAITVGSYEAYIDFIGYTEKEAKKIMDSIDLSVYE